MNAHLEPDWQTRLTEAVNTVVELNDTICAIDDTFEALLTVSTEGTTIAVQWNDITLWDNENNGYPSEGIRAYVRKEYFKWSERYANIYKGTVRRGLNAGSRQFN